jgi:hypothetical protein
MAKDASVEQRLDAIEAKLARLMAATGGPEDSPVERESFSAEEWTELGKQLDAFEAQLTAKQKAVLLTVLGAAAATFDRAGATESPVSGGATPITIAGNLSKVRLSDALVSVGRFNTAGVAGFGGGGEAENSVNVGGDVTSVHGDWTKDTARLSDAMIRGRWNSIERQLGGQLGGGQFGGGKVGGQVGGGFR